MDAHRDAFKETFLYSRSLCLFYGGFLIANIIFFTLTVHDNDHQLLALSFFLYIISSIINLISSSFYRVQVSTHGISARTFPREIFFPWQTIHSLQLKTRLHSLSLIDDRNKVMNLSFHTQNFDEIWETLQAQRPELIKDLIISEFHGVYFRSTLLGSIATIILGALSLNGKSVFSNVAIFPDVVLLIGFGGIIAALRMVRSIDLSNTELIIHYALTEKRIPLTDIIEVKKGQGMQTRAGQFIALANIREGKAAFYDNLLAWWRATRDQV